MHGYTLLFYTTLLQKHPAANLSTILQSSGDVAVYLFIYIYLWIHPPMHIYIYLLSPLLIEYTGKWCLHFLPNWSLSKNFYRKPVAS